MSQTQLFWAALLAAGALAAFLCWLLIRSHLRLRAHQAACARPGYEPRKTFTGTVCHISGLPAPPGIKLGVAANPDWGVAFAKERFRYAVPCSEITAIDVFSARELPKAPRRLWPQRVIAFRLREGPALLLSLPWPGGFARRLQRLK